MDNEYVRVTRYEVAPNATFDQRVSADTVVIPLGLPNGESVDDITAQQGIKFLVRGTQLRVPASPSGAALLLVNLRRHWDAPMKECAAPLTCAHPLKMSGQVIGETVSLFSNGFVTGFFHRLDRGGSLTSSYYSAKGTDHILYVPLTDVQVSFGGTDESLKAGQPYFSDASEVETDAGDKNVSWAVIRINVPKPGAAS